jgi:hypothetical protein
MVAVTQPDGSVKQVPAQPETVSQGLDALLTELETEMKNGDPATIKLSTRLWLIGSAAAGKGGEPDGRYTVEKDGKPGTPDRGPARPGHA